MWLGVVCVVVGVCCVVVLLRVVCVIVLRLLLIRGCGCG